MQNDYLTNKKNYNSNKLNHKEYFAKNRNDTKSKNVNINKLLNEVKINKKNKKKESWILFGLATLIIGVMGIFVSL